MTLATSSFLDVFKAAADEAEAAEARYRREAAQRIAALERERAFAFRRLNLMRTMAAIVAQSESEEAAVANASTALRSRLGWSTDSEMRTRTLSRFASVAQAVFRSFASADGAPIAPVQSALAEFETWYADNHQTPFWALFEHYVPETPLVDF